jgi:FdrA protein
VGANVTIRRVDVRRDTYVDSVGLLNVSRDMRQVADVVWANAVMGTTSNLDLLRETGFDARELEGLRANDLVLAVAAESHKAADQALQTAAEAFRGGEPAPEDRDTGAASPRSLDDAVAALSDANLALVSVPGAYAALETHKALTAGLHVLLFSDNVPLADEVELKRRAAQQGLLVMGPGAGTAMLGSTGLGFANAVRRGPVRVVAAAGTGAQEVMTLLHRWGSGVSDVIGVGGRDLSRAVRATMTRLAITAQRGGSADRSDEALLLVSKPPDPDVAEAVLSALGGRRAVCAFIGLDRPLHPPRGVRVTSTLEGAVCETLALLGGEAPDPGAGLRRRAAAGAQTLAEKRRVVRGVFSGGTLCYEAMVVLSRRLGAVHSNTPLHSDWGLPAPGGAHVCLDLGEEEYTRHRPHPMIDPLARADELERAGADPTTAVVLLDVVLGYGAHPDPAGQLTKVLDPISRRDEGPVVVAYVLGTDEDPQSAPEQRARLEEAGCVIAPTGARAALLAAAIATRRPELAEESP